MPLDTSIVGQRTTPIEHRVDARWIMAYAAGLGDPNPRMMDTASHSPVVAHPVFPVCVEWPVVLATGRLPGSETVTPDERARGVHAAHDLHIHRPIRAGDVLNTVGEVVGLEERKPGAAQMTRMETRDAKGELVCTTWQLGITRGVGISGPARWSVEPPALPTDAGTEPCDIEISLTVRPGAAHIYTECAHIWNPIHSDRAVALAAGLPDIILHGTATLALAVSGVVDEILGGDIARVCRLGGRFSAMVPVPDRLLLQIYRRGEESVRFRVRNGADQEAITQGFLCWRSVS
jgi:acyl dehydratase